MYIGRLAVVAAAGSPQGGGRAVRSAEGGAASAQRPEPPLCNIYAADAPQTIRDISSAIELMVRIVSAASAGAAAVNLAAAASVGVGCGAK